MGDGPAALQARVLWFDAQRGAPSRYVRPGWGEAGRAIPIFRRELNPVLVHDLMPTVAIGGGAYLRPLTILESRAVAVASLQLLSRLGADDRAAFEVARYFETFYAPREEFRDYHFLLDLYASLWQEPDFVSAVGGRGPDWAKQALLVTLIAGWYALQAPPLMPEDEDDGMVNTSPVMRLLIALQFIEHTVARGKPFETGIDLLEAVDDSPEAKELGIAPCRRALEFSVEYVQAVRERNEARNRHPELREHFEHVFAVLEEQLAERCNRGFASRLGMPDEGDLLAGFHETKGGERLLPQTYKPAPAVQRWFTHREALLFRHARPPRFWAEIDEFIGSVETRFADGAFEPSIVGRDAQGTVAVQLPETMPIGLRESVDITTQWLVFTATTEEMVVLRIEMALGGELELLFRRVRHLDEVRDIVGHGKIGLVFSGDELVSVPVTCPSTVLEASGFL